MTATADFAGLILAAGYASRMDGAPKALAELDGETLLEHLVNAFRRAGVADIFVVTGHEHARPEAACAALHVTAVYNPDFSRGMFSSVKAGLARLSGRGFDAALISPVDAALVLPRTIAALTRAWVAEREGRDGSGRIFLPAFLGKGGHPLLLPASHWAKVMARGDDGGLRGYVNGLAPDRVTRLALPDEGLLCDLDTPEDLRRAGDFLSATNRRAEPSPAEAWQALLSAVSSEELLAHSVLVAFGAHRLWRCFAGVGVFGTREAKASPFRAFCGGLLHDIARSRAGHAREGGALLRGLGWPETAAIAESHMDFPPEHFAALGIGGGAEPSCGGDLAAPLASACVYLADKYAGKEGFAPPAARFAAKRLRWERDPEALAAIEAREAATRLLGDWVAARLDRRPEIILETSGEDHVERRFKDAAASGLAAFTGPLRRVLTYLDHL